MVSSRAAAEDSFSLIVLFYSAHSWQGHHGYSCIFITSKDSCNKQIPHKRRVKDTRRCILEHISPSEATKTYNDIQIMSQHNNIQMHSRWKLLFRVLFRCLNDQERCGSSLRPTGDKRRRQISNCLPNLRPDARRKMTLGQQLCNLLAVTT